MDKFKQLAEMCKFQVSIEVNDHRNYKQTVRDYFKEREGFQAIFPGEVSDIVKEQMTTANTIVCVQFYPNNPVTFHRSWGHDIEATLDAALEQAKKECGK